MEKDYKIGNCPVCGKFISSFAISYSRNSYIKEESYIEIMQRKELIPYSEPIRTLVLTPCGCKTDSWKNDENGFFIAFSASDKFAIVDELFVDYQI